MPIKWFPSNQFLNYVAELIKILSCFSILLRSFLNFVVTCSLRIFKFSHQFVNTAIFSKSFTGIKLTNSFKGFLIRNFYHEMQTPMQGNLLVKQRDCLSGRQTKRGENPLSFPLEFRFHPGAYHFSFSHSNTSACHLTYRNRNTNRDVMSMVSNFFSLKISRVYSAWASVMYDSSGQ